MNRQTNTKTNLTEKEIQFLLLCLNYETIEEQLADNYSNAGIDDAMDLFAEHDAKKTRRQAAGGLITSLTNKGLGSLDIECDVFCLYELGVQAAFAAKTA